jgi:hypothetical protein
VQLRRQIDATRQDLGKAVGALAYKADVKNRGKELLENKKEALMEKVEEVKEKVPGIGGDGSEGAIGETIKSKLPDAGAIKDKLPSGDAVGEKVGALKDKLPDATPSTQDVKAKAQDAASAAGDHPIALAAGAAAVGLAAGLALPQTEIERQKLAPAARDARQQAQARAQDTIAQVKSAARDAAGSTVDAVRQKGQEQGGKIGDLAEKAADKADEKVT